MNAMNNVATRSIQPKRVLTSLLIYNLYISSWTAKGKDDETTKVAKEAQGVTEDVDAGNFIKSRLPGCKELATCNSYLGSCRTEFYNKSVPWGEIRNVRAGKVENHMKVMEWVGDKQEGLKPLVKAFGDVYLERVEEARYKLQNMFNADNYPPVQEVMARFRFTVKARPLTDTDDIRVMTEIPELERRRLEEEVQAETREAMQESLKYALEKLHAPILNMAKQLQRLHKGETKIMHDSLIQNVIDMADAAEVLNITNDERINYLAHEARMLIEGVTKKDLKGSDGMQVTKAMQAEQLAKRIEALF